MNLVRPNRPWKVYAWVVAVISTVFLAVMIWQGLYPFGNRIMANSDGLNQYINFYAWFRDAIRSGAGLKYSFSAVLGGNMQGVYAYYLGSPLYLLFLLFPRGELFGGLHLIIGLKLLWAGISFCAWTGKHNTASPWLRIAFSVSYALMGYMVTFYNLLSWLDAVALLPVVALGLERLVENKKPMLYIGALALTIMANYYVGFMVCVASVLFYCGIVGAKGGFRGSVALFSLSSVIAGALSGWILLPAVMALPRNRVEQTLQWDVNFPFFRIFSKLFTGTTSADEFINGLPVIFVGMIPLVFLILFYLNPYIRRRGKLVLTGMVLVMLLSFWIAPVNMLWHGASENQMFNYRYSFILSFLLLGGAWYGASRAKELPKRAFFLCGGLLTLGVALIFAFTYPYGSRNTRLFDVALLAVGLLLAVCVKKNRRFSAVLLLVLVTANGLLNTGLTVKNIRNGFVTAEYELNTRYGWNVQEAMALLPKQEGFYRVEKTFMGTTCDNMAFSIPGASNFTSLENSEILQFVQQLGLRSYTAWGRYTGDNPVATEALLGIRYLMSFYSVGQGREAYEPVGKTDGIYIYENPYALPLLMASKTIQPQIQEKGFFLQNACWSSLVGDGRGKIFHQAPVQHEEREGYTTRLLYTMPKSGIAYLQIPETENWQQRGYQIRLSESQKPLALDIYGSIYSLGSFAEGETVALEVITGEGKAFPELSLWVEDQEKLTQFSSQIRETPVYIEKRRDDHLVVTCTVGEETPYMASTIPYDTGWTVSVDGEVVPTEKNWNCMLAFPVTPGEHRIELTYAPPGKRVGIMMTGVGVIMTGMIEIYLQKRKNRKENSRKCRNGKLLSLLLLCAVLLCSLCGCNGKTYLGKYAGYYVEAEGRVHPMEDYFNGDNYLELDRFGKAVLMVNNTAHELKWKEKEGEITFKEAEDIFYGYIKDGVIVLDYMGWGMEMTFAMDGAQVPETTMENPEAYAEAVEALLPYWNGDWYGWWYISEGSGAYADEQMKIRDLAARIQLDKDARGSFVLWDMEHPYVDPLGEVILHVDPMTGAEGIGIGMSGQGSFMGQPVEVGDWLIDPSTAAYDNLLEIYGYYGDETGDFFYTVYLRPWGQSWDDVLEAQDPTKSPAELPEYYYLYLEALKTDTKPEDFFT